jgi:NNP family nitrate/nitrite transporter-like MFS transporter
MNLRDFRKAGHFPSLVCAFLYFDISFMIWVLIGALVVSISEGLWPRPAGVSVDDHLRSIASAKGMLVATPILGGAVLRLLLGLLTDHRGARRTGLLGMLLTAVPLLLGSLWATSFSEMLLVGALLGVAGASFAAALPLASRWYPPQYQGLAMGIAGAGNSGTALATFFGPLLARSSLTDVLGWSPGLVHLLVTTFGLSADAPLGWRSVFALALVPLTLTFVVFFLFAKDSPNQPASKPLMAYAGVLAQGDTWWFCFFYSVTFGGFVGLASFLNAFFKDQYFPLDARQGAVQAGYFTTLCVVAGSFLRPVGGYLADRFGGIRMLLVLYGGVATTMLGMALLPPLPVAIGLLFLGMGLLGMGNGSVFQLVPLRFPKEIGVITGIVGAAGGVGGFFLPNLLGGLKSLTGSYGVGFAVFSATGIACVLLMLVLRVRWESTFLVQVRSEPASAEEPALVPDPVAASGTA